MQFQPAGLLMFAHSTAEVLNSVQSQLACSYTRFPPDKRGDMQTPLMQSVTCSHMAGLLMTVTWQGY